GGALRATRLLGGDARRGLGILVLTVRALPAAPPPLAVGAAAPAAPTFAATVEDRGRSVVLARGDRVQHDRLAAVGVEHATADGERRLEADVHLLRRRGIDAFLLVGDVARV